MMKVEIPLEAIDELNTHIEEELDGATDFSDKLVGQINRNEKSAQINFPIDDEVGKAFSTVLEKLAVTYMKNVTKKDVTFSLRINMVNFFWIRSDQICPKWIKMDQIWISHLSKNVTIKPCYVYHENKHGQLIWIRSDQI